MAAEVKTQNLVPGNYNNPNYIGSYSLAPPISPPQQSLPSLAEQLATQQAQQAAQSANQNVPHPPYQIPPCPENITKDNWIAMHTANFAMISALTTQPPPQIQEISVVPTVELIEVEDVETGEVLEVEVAKVEKAKAKVEAEAVEVSNNKIHLTLLHHQTQYHQVVTNGGTVQLKWRPNACTQIQPIKDVVGIATSQDIVIHNVVTKEWMSRLDNITGFIHKLANCQQRSMPLNNIQLQAADSKKNRDLQSAQPEKSSILRHNSNSNWVNNNNNNNNKIYKSWPT